MEHRQWRINTLGGAHVIRNKFKLSAGDDEILGVKIVCNYSWQLCALKSSFWNNYGRERRCRTKTKRKNIISSCRERIAAVRWLEDEVTLGSNLNKVCMNEKLPHPADKWQPQTSAPRWKLKLCFFGMCVADCSMFSDAGWRLCSQRLFSW